MRKTIFITALLFVTSAVMTAHTGDYQYPRIDNKESNKDSLKSILTYHQYWDEKNQEIIDFTINAHFVPAGNDFTRLRVYLQSEREGRYKSESILLRDASNFIYPIVKGPVFDRTIEYVIPDRYDPDNKVIAVKLKVRFKVTDEGLLPNMPICEGKVTYRNMNDKYRAMVKGDTMHRTYRFDEKGRLIEFEDNEKNIYKM